MAILTVGSGQQYSSLSAAVAASHNGDTIAVEAGTYINDFPETIKDNITIEGVGGMATLEATKPVPNGMAILVTDANVTIENIAFTGATVSDLNGAGIRYQGGNLVLNNDDFYNNQEGMLAGTPSTGPGTGSITIDNSVFSHNGGDGGYAHNLYVNRIGNLTIDNSIFTDAIAGHEIKSRAENTTIENSHIFDGPTGTASYDIDLPNGGNAIIENNIIEQGPLTQNPAMIHVGSPATAGVPQWANTSVTIENNTITNDLHAADAMLLYNETSDSVDIANNQIYGLRANQIARGPATLSGNTLHSAGWIAPGVSGVLAKLGPLPDPVDPTLFVMNQQVVNGVVTASGPEAIAEGTKSGIELLGGTGFDILAAGSGTETLMGGSGGTDFLSGTGTDTMIAGSGANYMKMGGSHATIDIATGASGNVGIYGFNPTLDHIQISGTTESLASFIAGATNDAQGNAVVHDGSQATTMHGVSAAQLSSAWFTVTH